MNHMVSNLMERALLIANIAHQGQTDLKGCPYILYLLQVMHQLEDTEQKIVALLMDSFRIGHFSRGELASWGMPEHILAAVDALIHDPNEESEAFVQRCRENELAYVVKLKELEEKINLYQQLISTGSLNVLDHINQLHSEVNLLNLLQFGEEREDLTEEFVQTRLAERG